MLVDVFYRDPEIGESTHVATINCNTLDEDAALEYAYRRTQNIEGSWSRGLQIEDGYGRDMINGDYSSDVLVVAPLPTYQGRTLGHRSSMIGDMFVVNDNKYRVAFFGFEPVEE